MYLQIYGKFLKKPLKRCTFFVKKLTFPLFNKLYVRNYAPFARYFVISHVILMQ